MDLSLQSTIRHICDGLIREGDERISKAIYLSFDLRIQTDANNYNQRDIAVGVHMLRYMGLVLLKFDRDFLGGPIDIEGDWKFCSSHDSCWADSVECVINDVIRDVRNNMNASIYAKDYQEDKLTFSNDGRSFIMMQTCNILPLDKVKNLVYTTADGPKSYKRALVEGMYRDHLKDLGHIKD